MGYAFSQPQGDIMNANPSTPETTVAVNGGIPTTTVRRSDTIAKLTAALAKAVAELKNPPKDSVNPVLQLQVCRPRHGPGRRAAGAGPAGPRRAAVALRTRQCRRAHDLADACFRRVDRDDDSSFGRCATIPRGSARR